MDVTSIANLATTIAETGLKQEAGMAVLKRAQDIARTSAAQLLDAIPATPNLPAHLGKNINTTA
jgi:hypothetical protein